MHSVFLSLYLQKKERMESLKQRRTIMEEKVYTTTEAAKELGFTRQTVLNWIKSGEIKAFKIMRAYRINESEIKRIRGF